MMLPDARRFTVYIVTHSDDYLRHLINWSDYDTLLAANKA
jgi:hypothetical protein